MAMKMRLTQKMTQRMALTPQMRQSMHILQLPILELKSYLEQQMEENPILEDSQESEFKESASDREIQKLIELSSQERKDSEDYFNTGYSQEEIKEKQNYRESLITKQITLQEHLLGQLGLQPLNEIDYKIGELIIGTIDENGYFQGAPEEAAQTLKVGTGDVQSVLSLIQTFEPAGVGARNLKECLLIQLDSKGKHDSLAYRVVENHLVDLAKNKTELIAKQLKAPLDSVKKALKEISALEPKPGRSFGRVESRRILPDIIVEKIEDNYEMTINGRELPSLKISPQYKNLLKLKDTPEEAKGYLKEKLNSALWLIKAVNKRQETIRRVAECIVQTQKEFFELGMGHLKPLTMKEVARIVERNESTISRVVNSKYMQTPYGIFELSYFFSGSFKTDGQDIVSTDTVKTQIATLIEDEDPQHPLSDDKIVTILRSQGINIARRTVAKYREELKILPSHLRKK
jgi:RNA polymerase sigma-54 factor